MMFLVALFYPATLFARDEFSGSLSHPESDRRHISHRRLPQESRLLTES
jgi:hypothetical protein